MTQKILVSKPGKDALVSTTPDDFYLHSDYPLLKVHASGTFVTLNDGTKTITHSLGYRPFAIVFSQFVDTDGVGGAVKSTEYYQHDWIIDGASVTFEGITKIYANTVEISVGNTDVPVPGQVNGIYYIFKDEI
jgi:hypothetical protein